MTFTRQQAKDGYRKAWAEYQNELDDARRQSLEKTMDYLQPYIADSPKDPRWSAFTATLPGFLEFWKHTRERILANIREEQFEP